MNNPHELFGISDKDFNPGAIKSPVDHRDYHYDEIGYATPPFDWSTTFDVEQKLSLQLPTKNQGASGSCGGQAEGYYGQVLSFLIDRNWNEKSAKFTYAQCFAPGGGSNGQVLAQCGKNNGWGQEALTTSYQNGEPPTEQFMEAIGDITSDARAEAKKDTLVSYALVGTDIDSVAKAIRDNYGVRLGVIGSNNGTWLSAIPKVPIDGEDHWYHWLYAGRVGMINGKKAIGVKNSWGPTVGTNGWQWLTEDYFVKSLTNDQFGLQPIWECRTYVTNPSPTPIIFKHTFTVDLQAGMTGSEVNALQTALQVDGEFPASVQPTGYYGTITQQAVQKFQLKHGIVTAAGPGYGRCGPKTRAELNRIFGSI